MASSGVVLVVVSTVVETYDGTWPGTVCHDGWDSLRELSDDIQAVCRKLATDLSAGNEGYY